MPARKYTLPKLFGRRGDLAALGLSRQQIDDAVKSGTLRILKRSPKQGQRYFPMVNANRLMAAQSPERIGSPPLLPALSARFATPKMVATDSRSSMTRSP